MMQLFGRYFLSWGYRRVGKERADGPVGYGEKIIDVERFFGRAMPTPERGKVLLASKCMSDDRPTTVQTDELNLGHIRISESEA